MARIIYGISGQGFGHSTRSREVIRHLIRQGHDVLVFTYGQAPFLLGKEFSIYEVPGLGLSYKDNKLQYFNTIAKNAISMTRQSSRLKEAIQRFRDFDPQLVITDFEPISAYLAKRFKIPLISLDNQHQLTHTKVKVPTRHLKDLWADRFVIRSMVNRAHHYLVTSFFETNPSKRNISLFPPIIREEILQLSPQKGDYILVYQTTEFDGIIKHLKGLDHKFIVFGLKKEGTEGNIEYRQFDYYDWLNYLANCKAIIANAGLSLMTEGLHLGKPYLAIPIQRQVEQVINALYLERLGYGKYSRSFNTEEFFDFILKLDEYEKNLVEYKRQDNTELFRALEKLIDDLAL